MPIPPPDSLLLKTAVGKRLLTPAVAKEVYHQAKREKRPAREVLLERGLVTEHLASVLTHEAQRAQTPRIIGGHRLIVRIGKGGMGTVYRAVQLSMDREVALKVIARQHLRDQSARDRFLREARAAGRVNHPHVILCHDAGQDGDVLYQAMELVTGGDVEQARRAAGGTLSPRRALEIIRDGALGLQAIHEAGLLHRDIKPGNIFLTAEGHAKLGDLGLARLQNGEDHMTSTGAAVGTPAFMSPEQAGGEPDLDIRSDIYALGSTLFCLVTGRPPYTGHNAWAVVAAVIKEPFPDPRTIIPDLHADVAQLILEACAKAREDRMPTPRDLADACMALLADPNVPGTSVAATPAVAAASLHTEPSAISRRTTIMSKRWQRARRALRRRRALLAGTILLGLGVMSWYLLVHRPAAVGTAITSQAPASRPAH